MQIILIKELGNFLLESQFVILINSFNFFKNLILYLLLLVMLILKGCPCAYCARHFTQYSLYFYDAHVSFYFHLHKFLLRFHQLREPNLDLHNKMKMEQGIPETLTSYWFLKDDMPTKLDQTLLIQNTQQYPVLIIFDTYNLLSLNFHHHSHFFIYF